MTTTKQFIKYGGVAAGSAAADYAVFSVLLLSGIGVLYAQMIARIAGGGFSFAMNKRWSFNAKVTGAGIIESRRFLLLYGFSYMLALGLLYTSMEWGGMGAYPAKILADIACFVVNFLVMQRYVFSGRDGITARLRRLLFGETR